MPKKVLVKIYNRKYTKSSHYYLPRQSSYEDVARNHLAISADLGATNLAIINQVHGSTIIDANNLWDIGSEPDADGMYTSKKAAILGIQTADCVPVLIASSDGDVIGAAHCGWRSAFAGILEILVSKMRSKSNEELLAIIGPSIQMKSYEVDANFYTNFIKKSDKYGQFFILAKDAKYLFDLPGFVAYLLKDLNVRLIKHFNDDTYQLPELYPSYRYASHNNLGGYKGSILSTIHIK